MASDTSSVARLRYPLTSRHTVLVIIGSLLVLGSIYTGWSLGTSTYGFRVGNSPPEQAEAAGDNIPARVQSLHMNNLALEDSSQCGNYSGSDRVAVIVKTGATEALDKLPAQLVTSLRCVPDPILVSDLEQTIGPYVIHDVLARASPGLKESSPEFEIYRMQHEYLASGRVAELRSLSKLPIVEDDWRTKGKSAAWGLDKYKFLHMVELAWDLQPDRDWYVFIEADTYLSWRNLNNFLSAYDPTRPWYFGSPVRMHEHPTVLFFAYGGAGFILSGSVVRNWVVNHAGLANRWDSRVPKMWFGDFVIADALDEELKVKLTDATPMMHPDQPHLVPFGEVTWCRPVVTLHHLDSREFDQVYQMELAHNMTGLRFQDVYRSAYKTGLPFKKGNWDNLADDKKYALAVVPNDVDETHGQWEPKDYVDPHLSFEACELACTRNEACFQFNFETISNVTASEPKISTACYLSKIFRFGFERGLESWGEKEKFTKSWLSGWRSDRIAKWVEHNEQCP